jgi:hypothetical protein
LIKKKSNISSQRHTKDNEFNKCGADYLAVVLLQFFFRFISNKFYFPKCENACVGRLKCFDQRGNILKWYT